jgi:hypothetical protein
MEESAYRLLAGSLVRKRSCDGVGHDNIIGCIAKQCVELRN